MHGYRFFEEYRDEGRKDSLNSVVAIDVGRGPFVQEGGVCYRAVCTDREKSDVGQRGVRMVLFNAEYLGTHCKRISEQRARELHPEVFSFLESLA
jgi:hypothetical protein